MWIYLEIDCHNRDDNFLKAAKHLFKFNDYGITEDYKSYGWLQSVLIIVFFGKIGQ